jgi:acyl-CoA thioester hydrolase
MNVETRFRVRYAETDKMGVVYYANYFVWMEIGRTDYCRSAGFTYREMEAEHSNLAVAEATCQYLAPAYYDDEILILTSLDRLHRRLAAFSYSITNAHTGQKLAQGKTVHLSVGKNGRTVSIPDRFYSLLLKYQTPIDGL